MVGSFRKLEIAMGQSEKVSKYISLIHKKSGADSPLLSYSTNYLYAFSFTFSLSISPMPKLPRMPSCILSR